MKMAFITDHKEGPVKIQLLMHICTIYILYIIYYIYIWTLLTSFDTTILTMSMSKFVKEYITSKYALELAS